MQTVLIALDVLCESAVALTSEESESSYCPYLTFHRPTPSPLQGCAEVDQNLNDKKKKSFASASF